MRVGSTTSKTRDAVLDATQTLMLEGGYARVSYRNVAAAAGVTPALVQYYFPRLDELFVALLQRGTEQAVELIHLAAASEQPLRNLWRYARDATGGSLVMEFLALGKHRPSIGDEIGRGGRQVRQAQAEALSARWHEYGTAVDGFTPESMAFVMAAVARMVVLEEAFGLRTGHAEITDAVEALLDRAEPRSAGTSRSKRRGKVLS